MADTTIIPVVTSTGAPLLFGFRPVVMPYAVNAQYPVPSAYSLGDYQHAMAALLPRGRAWSRDADSVQQKLIMGLAGATYRCGEDAGNLLRQTYPATSEDMLGEWESTLGLPGAFGAAPDTTIGRQKAVASALTDTGGQSAAYFIGLAASLGFTITISQYTAFSVAKPIGTPIAADSWAHTWRVNASASIASSYTVTADVVPATGSYGNPLLDAVMGAFKPAHTVVIMSYT